MFMVVAPVACSTSPACGRGAQLPCGRVEIIFANLSRDPHRQGFETLHETRIDPLGFADHLDVVESLEDLFPDNLELDLAKPQADAAVDAEAEREMRARAGAVNDEFVALFDRVGVAVARNVPHHDLVTFLD